MNSISFDRSNQLQARLHELVPGGAHTFAKGSDQYPEGMAPVLTRGKGADVVLDIVGADQTLALGAAVTRPLGHLTIVGIAGGSLPISFFGIAYEVSVATTYWGTLPELMEVISLANSGRIRAHVQRFGLDEANAVYKAMRDGTVEGRAVIVPG